MCPLIEFINERNAAECTYSSWRDDMWENIASLTSEKVPLMMLLPGGEGE